MILRKFIKHVSEQNWFAVGLDVVVVVLGIFLGMQVSAWNEDRSKHDLEAHYLAALKVDIEVSIDYLDDRLVRINKQTHALEVILGLTNITLDSMSDIDAAKVIHNGLNSAAILPVQLRTYEDLKGANNVSLFRSLTLKDRLRALDAHVLQIRSEESERLKTLYAHIDPMLLKYPSYVELTRFWRNYNERGTPVTHLLGVHSAKEMFADPKLLNVSILMLGITRTEVRFLKDLEPIYKEILTEIGKG